MFRTGDRIEPTEESDNLCGGVVMEDMEVTNDTPFSNRPFAVYVKLDYDQFTEFYDAFCFRKVL